MRDEESEFEPAPVDELPDYLRQIEGLPYDLAALAAASESRRLTRGERRRIDAGIKAACKRVRWAKRQRDGKD